MITSDGVSLLKMGNIISFLGFDVYICDLLSNVLFVDRNTGQIYMCFYTPPTKPIKKGLFGFGVVHCDPTTGQPLYLGSEYGLRFQTDRQLSPSHINSFFKEMFSDIEKTYENDSLFPLFKTDKFSEQHINQLARQLGFAVDCKII